MYRYQDFINERRSDDDSDFKQVYWDYDDVMNEEWFDVKTTKDSVLFRLRKEEKGSSYSDRKHYRIFLDPTNKEAIMLPDKYSAEDFWEKFRVEFLKRPAKEYLENLVYKPKCLSEIQHLIDADKFGI